MSKFIKARLTVFANSLDPWVPEFWANETLRILENSMVVSRLVNRDFSPYVQRQGDVVNTRQPASFTGERKVDGDNVTVQDATATNVPVTLNQHCHVSFRIYDGEESKSLESLVDFYIKPAAMALAQQADELVMYQIYDFLATAAGQLGTAPTVPTILNLREKMLINKVPFPEGIAGIIPPAMEADLLGIDSFFEADKVGDQGTAMREASLWKKFGIDWFMSQNAPSVASGSTTHAAAIDNGNITAGSTVLTIDGTSETLVAGSWCTIAGDMTPQLITAVSGAPTTQITVSPGLASDVVDGAVVTVYVPGAINLPGSSYAANYAKGMAVDGFMVAPKIGQLASIGAAASLAASAKYGVLNTSTSPTTTLLDVNRGLDAAAANDAVVGLGPAGNYGLAFHKDAMTLAIRPLALPQPPVKAALINYNGLSMRAIMTYEGLTQSTLVTLDFLAGVKTLNTSLGAVILG